MAFADLWNRTLVYFGIAEEEDWDDVDGYVTNEELERSYSDRPNVRRLSERRRQVDYGNWAEEAAAETQVASSRPRLRAAAQAQAPAPAAAAMAAVAGSTRVHLVVPKSFNDAQQIADRFKEAIPVILNLQSSDPDLSKRLIDFASGLTYALDGGMQRVADKVFLLTPRNVEVSAEERARLLERGFFNQA
jgi:cell division inhibitor SepF